MDRTFVSQLSSLLARGEKPWKAGRPSELSRLVVVNTTQGGQNLLSPLAFKRV
jgi:hypothetical protein